MSSPTNENKDFESLYNELKEEYEQSKKDNDEICKEYESTIQLLTESVETFKKEKKDLQAKLSKIENDQKIFKREKETLIKKNKDKQIDIQCLNEQNDKLNELIKKLKEEKSLFDTKIVTLENDADHYQNKIREYEDFIDELKSQLEDALEENITLQTEFETYKLNTGDQLLRKDEEIRDIRNDITNKDKIIQRLNKKPSERFNIQKVQQKLIKDKKFMRYPRRYTIAENDQDFDYINLGKKLKNIEENENENENGNEDGTVINKTYKKTKTLNKDCYQKSLTSCKTSQENIDSNKKEKENNSNHNTNNSNNYNCSQKNVTSIFNFNDESAYNTNNISKTNTIKKVNKNENEKNGLTTIIKRQFGDLVICEGNKIYLNPLIHKLLSKEQIREFAISLKNMLIRIRQRKNNLKNVKNAINEKFEKMKQK